MKYIDAALLRKEIEFAKSVYGNPKRVVHGVADAYLQDGRAAMCDDILKKIDSLQQEQPESSKGKFVFPNFLYARTVDNKTIDVSYTPQSLDAIEYIKNDYTEQQEVDLDNHIIMEEIRKCECNPNEFDFASHFFELGKNARKEDLK